MLVIRWSLYDKPQAEKIIRKFCNLNRRIERHIELFCLGSRLGLDSRHLNRLTIDQNAKQLGFHVDAKWRLGSISEPSGLEQSFEIKNPRWLGLLSQTSQESGQYKLLQSDSTDLLVETRSYVPLPQMPNSIDPRTESRVNTFARLFNEPKQQDFRIPRCLGWAYVPWRQQIGFFFEVPPSVNPKPVSLLDLLNITQMKVSLSNKFLLAHALAQCMVQLHLVQWVRR